MPVDWCARASCCVSSVVGMYMLAASTCGRLAHAVDIPQYDIYIIAHIHTDTYNFMVQLVIPV